MVTDFMRYYPKTTIFHGCWFNEILQKNHNISWLQISWDVTPAPKYLLVADFMRYYTKTTMYRGCRFREIFHQNHNISWLQISWDITLKPQDLMVAYLQFSPVTMSVCYVKRCIYSVYIMNSQNHWKTIDFNGNLTKSIGHSIVPKYFPSSCTRFNPARCLKKWKHSIKSYFRIRKYDDR